MAKETDSDRNLLIARFDALIRLFVESKKDDTRMTDSFAARILNSAGLTPTEIAKIFGKKSATDIAPYLYKKTLRRKGHPDAKAK